MKNSLLFVSLFLISVLVISGCAQLSPRQDIKDSNDPSSVSLDIWVGPEDNVFLMDSSGRKTKIEVELFYPEGFFIKINNDGSLDDKTLDVLCCNNKVKKASHISQDGDDITITCTGSTCSGGTT